jgi:ppGpp synthetase/RelA/SpoT-type nucleotidyltranferase
MSDLEDARLRWLSERDNFELFGKQLASLLERRLKEHGKWFEVSSRSKEPDSLIRKLIKKPHHIYDSLGDKCGVRIVFRYKSDVDIGTKVAAELFDCGPVEHKVHTLGAEKVGYLSAHIDIRFRKSDALAQQFDPSVFRAELQVRSLAQHLWSEMAHDSIYKNDETLLPLPDKLKRRVNLLAGLIEIADDEFDRIESQMPEIPEIALLKALEHHYYSLTTRSSDPELSLDVIRLLSPLYKMDSLDIAQHLNDFYQTHVETLRDVFEEASPERSAFLFQPEALMIYDRLETDATEVRKAWNTKYSDRELERIANAFGISFD